MTLNDKKPLELNADFNRALDLLEKTNSNFFITGRAGTGKSTLLQLFRTTTKKKLAVLAPTGVAALNVKGQTIHSFFHFPARPIAAADIKKVRARRVYQNLDALIIDEISMVRADLLDNIDRFLRVNRENSAPFGGVQMIFFGDLFQLPPVVASEAETFLFSGFYDSPFYFSAHVFREGFDMQAIELEKVYRQESRHFLRLLGAIRQNSLDYEDLEDLNERYLPNFVPSEFYITLSPRNYRVDEINTTALRNLEGREFVYHAEIKGEFDPKFFPTDTALRLKIGAQVMFIKNDPEKQFVNGTIGVVTMLSAETAEVEIEEDGKKLRFNVPVMEWEILRHVAGRTNPNEIETEVIGVFKQLPLRLAWAITIHKSQGKTFDKVIIDMGKGAFEHGQTYVALSRCRTLEGIVLKQKIRMQDVLVDERVVEFYEKNF